MLKSLYNTIIEWNQSTNDRQKLQHLYVIIAIASVLVAGVVSLIDQDTGQDILKITGATVAVFLINAVLWSLLESIVVARLSGRRRRQ